MPAPVDPRLGTSTLAWESPAWTMSGRSPEHPGRLFGPKVDRPQLSTAELRHRRSIPPTAKPWPRDQGRHPAACGTVVAGVAAGSAQAAVEDLGEHLTGKAAGIGEDGAPPPGPPLTLVRRNPR